MKAITINLKSRFRDSNNQTIIIEKIYKKKLLLLSYESLITHEQYNDQQIRFGKVETMQEGG